MKRPTAPRSSVGHLSTRRLSARQTAACFFALSVLATDPATPAAGADDTSRPPNVIVILADDLGYADVSCYGGKISTPHVDRMAAEGVRFTDAHSSSAVCTPTRYGLLTGRYNWRSRLKRSVLGGLSPRLIEADRETIASWLGRHGYHSACVGKWHLGMDWVVKPGKQVSEYSIESRDQVFNVDYSKPITNGPNAVGFDYFYGISASLDMVPYVFIEQDRVTELPTEDRDFAMMHDRDEDRRRTRKGPTAPGFDAADVLPAIAEKSAAYIDRRAEAAKAAGDDRRPFFLYVPFASPHTPILPTESWQGESEINPYADFVMQTDWAVGEILKALERNGLADDTLIVFSSDNGCSPQARFDELAEHDHLPSGPFRGHKADLFEGGHRVPFVVRWPGKVAAGGESDQLVCLTDLFATAAEVAGAKLPDDAAEDSYSLLAAAKDPSAASRRDHIVSHSINGSFAIREGDWKLMLCPDSGGWSAPRPGRNAAEDLPARQLYHLGDDPGEQDNRIAGDEAQADRLLQRLEEIVRTGRSTPGDPQPNTGEVDIWAASPRSR